LQARRTSSFFIFGLSTLPCFPAVDGSPPLSPPSPLIFFTFPPLPRFCALNRAPHTRYLARVGSIVGQCAEHDDWSVSRQILVGVILFPQAVERIANFLFPTVAPAFLNSSVFPAFGPARSSLLTLSGVLISPLGSPHNCHPELQLRSTKLGSSR